MRSCWPGAVDVDGRSGKTSKEVALVARSDAELSSHACSLSTTNCLQYCPQRAFSHFSRQAATSAGLAKSSLIAEVAWAWVPRAKCKMCAKLADGQEPTMLMASSCFSGRRSCNTRNGCRNGSKAGIEGNFC